MDFLTGDTHWKDAFILLHAMVSMDIVEYVCSLALARQYVCHVPLAEVYTGAENKNKTWA